MTALDSTHFTLTSSSENDKFLKCMKNGRFLEFYRQIVVAIIVMSGLLDFVEKYNYNRQKINRIYGQKYLR